MREIKKSEFKVTDWSGGQTTQLYIYPEGADFSKRDFIFRISSASFTGTSSNFSDFKGYQRYILPLDGFIKIKHDGLYERMLNPYEAEYFDGKWKTYSENSLDTIDYNFIVKNGEDASMEIVKENKKILTEGYTCYVFSKDDFEIIFSNNKQILNGGSLYIIDDDFEISNMNKEIIICKYK